MSKNQTQSKIKLYYCDTFELPLPENHRFPMTKYTLLRERIAESQLSLGCELKLPPSASDEEILLVHDFDYLDRIKSGRLTDVQIRRIGFPWSPEMVERSRRSTGATVAAAEAAITDGISANLAGGTHHAFADSGQGYCVFNDVCVAAKTIQRRHRSVGRVMVVDCDVHQGNGTASIAADDPTLFSLSVHCSVNFPFKKTDGDLDIALPPGTQDDEYLSRLKAGIDSAMGQFSPDFVFYVAGADPFTGDRLGKLDLTKSGLRRRDELVINYFAQREIPVAISMAGGYAPNVEDIVDIHFATIEIACLSAKQNFSAKQNITRQ